jgi:hypothetical protein
MLSLAVLFDPSRIAIQPHTCPTCLGPMILMRIKPSRIGFETRTFQGVNCDHVDKVVTETYAIKWMSSGLRAPVQDPGRLRALDGPCASLAAG